MVDVAGLNPVGRTSGSDKANTKPVIEQWFVVMPTMDSSRASVHMHQASPRGRKSK